MFLPFVVILSVTALNIMKAGLCPFFFSIKMMDGSPLDNYFKILNDTNGTLSDDPDLLDMYIIFNRLNPQIDHLLMFQTISGALICVISLKSHKSVNYSFGGLTIYKSQVLFLALTALSVIHTVIGFPFQDFKFHSFSYAWAKQFEKIPAGFKHLLVFYNGSLLMLSFFTWVDTFIVVIGIIYYRSKKHRIESTLMQTNVWKFAISMVFQEDCEEKDYMIECLDRGEVPGRRTLEELHKRLGRLLSNSERIDEQRVEMEMVDMDRRTIIFNLEEEEEHTV